MSPVPVDGDAFREALSRFPSGVTVVTTRDVDGVPWGFTASAFASLSATPPLVLVCLDRAADCHEAFEARSDRFAVNILAVDHEDLALRFASKGADKFAGGGFDDGLGGVPTLPGAVAVLECRTDDRVTGGDHTILIGLVEQVRLGDGEPMVYANRGFRRLAEPVTGSR